MLSLTPILTADNAYEPDELLETVAETQNDEEEQAPAGSQVWDLLVPSDRRMGLVHPRRRGLYHPTGFTAWHLLFIDMA